MGLTSDIHRMLSVESDGLADYRARIAIQLCAIAAVLLTPFTLMQIWSERYLLVIVLLGIQVMLALNYGWLKHRGKPLVAFWLLIGVLMAGVCLSVALQGNNGVFWAYPTLFIGFFVTPRRMANVMGLVFLLALSSTVGVFLGLGEASRVFATLALNLVMINIVLNVVSELQVALVRQATTDPLTGAFNRRHMDQLLAQAAHQNSERGDVLLMVDIDHFKRVNDTYGHDVGDEVLRNTVNVITSRMRRSDVLFRMGGEEFVLLLPDTLIEDALRVAEDLRARVELSELLPGKPGGVTVSIGVGEKRRAQTPDEWLKVTDAALYDAKRTGRNRVFLAQGMAGTAVV